MVFKIINGIVINRRPKTSLNAGLYNYMGAGRGAMAQVPFPAWTRDFLCSARSTLTISDGYCGYCPYGEAAKV
jgi:hypothetical protein